ncbi:MAG: squalene/phytoene synthase family protein [Verrucomicrobia bacterium]|nr:squalene/phytoene synthase family protein [Verrucomicrobiota bacterium]
MNSSVQHDLLGNLLRDVSRSFYLTLRALPSAIRPQIGLAYLLARAADTIADTELLRRVERLERLLQFRNCLNREAPTSTETMVGTLPGSEGMDAAGTQAERRLLRRLPECLEMLRSLSQEDQARVAEVVTRLTIGMELDLRRFSGSGNLEALKTFQELEDYTYHVAGCVGPFWTKMCMAHLPAFAAWDSDRMCELGIRFGKALQWTNVLRDIPRDLRNGRCYLPSEDLASIGLTPADLRHPSAFPRLRSLYHRHLDHALDHYRSAWEYTMAVPKACPRVRLACVWPIWIGLETLAILRQSENPLDSARRIRITRLRIYAIMFRSFVSVRSDTLLNRHQQSLMKAASGLRG